MKTLQQTKLKVFQGKKGKNNQKVLRSIVTGPKAAYDVYKSMEDELEYSTSNRRLRDLEKTGYLSRVPLTSGSNGRTSKIHYGFTLRGAITTMVFADDLPDGEWQMFIKNHAKHNSLLPENMFTITPQEPVLLYLVS